ncbi:hypothetical protein [Anaerotignum sp.]
MKPKGKGSFVIFIAGAICVLGSFFLKDEYYANMLRAWGIAWVVNGFLQLRQYFYYSKPEHQAEYEEKQTERRIGLKDERKIMLRQMAGHKSYQIMFFLLLAASFLFALLRVEWWITAIVCLLWVAQYVMGIVLFRYYEKRL